MEPSPPAPGLPAEFCFSRRFGLLQFRNGAHGALTLVPAPEVPVQSCFSSRWSPTGACSLGRADPTAQPTSDSSSSSHSSNSSQNSSHSSSSSHSSCLSHSSSQDPAGSPHSSSHLHQSLPELSLSSQKPDPDEDPKSVLVQIRDVMDPMPDPGSNPQNPAALALLELSQTKD